MSAIMSKASKLPLISAIVLGLFISIYALLPNSRNPAIAPSQLDAGSSDRRAVTSEVADRAAVDQTETTAQYNQNVTQAQMSLPRRVETAPQSPAVMAPSSISWPKREVYTGPLERRSMRDPLNLLLVNTYAGSEASAAWLDRWGYPTADDLARRHDEAELQKAAKANNLRALNIIATRKAMAGEKIIPELTRSLVLGSAYGARLRAAVEFELFKAGPVQPLSEGQYRKGMSFVYLARHYGDNQVYGLFQNLGRRKPSTNLEANNDSMSIFEEFENQKSLLETFRQQRFGTLTFAIERRPGLEAIQR
jgi:hypothetical protein